MSNKNNDFDFEKFAVDAINQIDGIRSYFDLGTSLGSEQQLNSGSPISTKNKQRESRINAFYRLIGLPAVLPAKKESTQERVAIIDRHNNGNVHESLRMDTSIGGFEIEKSLKERQTNFTSKITPKEIDTFLVNNVSKISGSVTTNASDKRLRGHLFPMVVDGRIRVHPARRRIAGAFLDKDSYEKRWEKDIYPPPLIEQILYIRLKGSSVVNSESQSSLGSMPLKDLIVDFKNSLDLALNSIAPSYERAVETANKVKASIGSDVVPVIANVAHENHDLVEPVEPKRSGQLNVEQAQVAARKAIQEAKLWLLGFNDTDFSLETKNVYSSGLLSSLIEIQVPRNAISQAKRIEDRVEEAVAETESLLKQAVRSIELSLGSFSGISGIDILVTIVALFQINEEHLVALLNKDSKDRLEILKGNLESLQKAANISIYDAVKVLQDKVSELIDSVSNYIKDTSLITKKELQNSQETEE